VRAQPVKTPRRSAATICRRGCRAPMPTGSLICVSPCPTCRVQVEPLCFTCKLQVCHKRTSHEQGVLARRRRLRAANVSVGYFWHLTTFAEHIALELYRRKSSFPSALRRCSFRGALRVGLSRSSARGPRSGRGAQLRFAGLFAPLAWSFTTLPVAAKYRMSSIAISCCWRPDSRFCSFSWFAADRARVPTDDPSNSAPSSIC